MPKLRSALKAVSTLAAVMLATSASAVALGAQQVTEAVPAIGYVREAIDQDLGFPDTHIAAIAQTADGYFWLGTRRGLVRFDGLGTTVFTPRNTPGLRSWAINALTADREGALWISTDQGLTVYEGGTFRHIPATEVPATTVWKVHRDRRGRVWVAGRFGVRVGDGRRFTPVPNFREHIYSVLEDRQGRLWFGGRRVLASYVEGDSAPVRWPAAGDQRVYDLALDSTGALWIGLREGARQLDITDRTRIVERRRILTASAQVRAQVWSLTVDADNALWLATDTRGVLRFDGRTLQDVEGPRGTAPDPVWWVTTDRRGTIWAGTSGGALRFRRSAFEIVRSGLTAPGAWAIRGDREGTLWLSGDDGQVAWFDGQRWRPTFRGLVDRTAAAIWPSVRGGVIAADDESHLWHVTKTGVQDITAAVDLPDVAPFGLFEDPDGTIYNNTDRGLLRARDGTVDSVYRHLGLEDTATPWVMMRDRRDRLIMGRPYLTIGEGPTRRRFAVAEGLTDEGVVAVHETGDALWIATADSGLFVLRGDRVRSLGAAHPLLNRSINGIIDDRQGFLWLTTGHGLLRVRLSELLAAAERPGQRVVVRQFDRTDGLPTTDIRADYQSQLHVDRRGQIWLPTFAGPVRFDPTQVVDDTIPPQIHVERVEIDGVLQPRADSVRAAGHPGRVDVRFATTDALVPSRVRTEYRIVGVSDDWIDAGRRRTLTFGPLTGGRYRLEIRAAAEDGDWTRMPAVMYLDVPRSLTEQPWFFPLLAVLASLGAYGFTRWRLASARARERELSALVSRRTADLEASRAELEDRVAERSAALSRELAERYRLEQRLESARRMASLGRLAGGVSHEINNALSTVLGFAQLAQLSARQNERLTADLGEVVRAGRRAAGITQQLLAFARQHHTTLVPTALDQVVRDNLRSLQQLCAPLALEFSGAEALPFVNADVGQMEQLLVNLVKNARDAKPTDGRIRLSLGEHTLDQAQTVGDHVLPAGRYVVLTVRDRGQGIAPEALQQLFEPFFTTKALNEGTGLGLAVVQGIVARHDGAIEVDSAVGEGTTFRIWFPAPAIVVGSTAQEVDVRGQGETILVVEDDASIRQFATRMLQAQGYRVLDAEDGATATALVGKSIETIDLVLTDVLMPRTNGLELARRLRAARPELPVIFMTGFPGLDDAAQEELRATGPMLAKPFTQEALLRTVHEALAMRAARVR